jgi:hypothetical protein
MDGWCPCEDIFSGVTTMHKAREFYKTAITLNSYIDLAGGLIRNDKEIRVFPAQQANYFDLETILKTFGFSETSLYDIGGVVRLVSHFECDDWPFMGISKFFWVIAIRLRT